MKRVTNISTWSAICVFFFSFSCVSFYNVETIWSLTWDWRRTFDLDPWTRAKRREKKQNNNQRIVNLSKWNRFISSRRVTRVYSRAKCASEGFFFFIIWFLPSPCLCFAEENLQRKWKKKSSSCLGLSCLTHEWLWDLQMWFIFYFFLYFELLCSRVLFVRLWLCTCYKKNELHWFQDKIMEKKKK